VKRFFPILIIIILLGSAACTNTSDDEVKLRVGATPVPHAEILEEIKPLLAEKGIELEIIEFTDYVQPNLQLGDGEIEANFFQHIPYLEAFCADHSLELTHIASVHIEPMGIYSHQFEDPAAIPSPARVAIPNDATNSGRALLLLEKSGLIDLKTDELPTPADVTPASHDLEIIELEAASLPRTLVDVDLAVINTNYALEADLNPVEDSLFIEDASSPYVNVLAVRQEDADKESLQELARVLTSSEVREFIQENYGQAIVPAF